MLELLKDMVKYGITEYDWIHWYRDHPHWWKQLVSTDEYRAYYRRVYGQEPGFAS